MEAVVAHGGREDWQDILERLVLPIARVVYDDRRCGLTTQTTPLLLAALAALAALPALATGNTPLAAFRRHA